MRYIGIYVSLHLLYRLLNSPLISPSLYQMLIVQIHGTPTWESNIVARPETVIVDMVDVSVRNHAGGAFGSVRGILRSILWKHVKERGVNMSVRVGGVWGSKMPELMRRCYENLCMWRLPNLVTRLADIICGRGMGEPNMCGCSDLMYRFADLMYRFADLMYRFADLMYRFADLMYRFADLICGEARGGGKRVEQGERVMRICWVLGVGVGTAGCRRFIRILIWD
ncbi:hypothetical protein K469DRAFT_381552 [Zopfia rhizophila CBS 207.26]|uniref:Uncharacterized protein n=1 Tax=Zopfia rhizophila CBS 207.26 TaxID=1314779 RepID=A0A6A6DGM5_9PEZI|nr:hypothetical protein K469DRAFT_381552 [Zopfia rhizophila CBS 207.26]